MSFPFTHTLLTFHWDTPSNEHAQVGIRCTVDQPLTQTELDAIRNAFGVFWSSTGSDVDSRYIFRYVKAAIIQPDGKYPPDGEAQFSVTANTPGLVTSGPVYPLQVCSVATLGTTQLRGRASKGRVFLPPIAVALAAANPRWTSPQTTTRASRFASALGAINGILDSKGDLCVMSRIGSGAFHLINSVRVGDRPDIQRRRDNETPENYVVANVT